MLVDGLPFPAGPNWGQAFAPASVPEFLDDCYQGTLIGLVPERQMIEATGSITANKVNGGAERSVPLEDHSFAAATHSDVVRNARREARAPRICQGTAYRQVVEHQ